MKKLALTITAWLLATSTAVAQVVTGGVPNTFVNGTIIDATQVNADYAYIISQVNANAAKNGVNNDLTALTALATPLTPVQSGSSIYYAGTATGTANAIVVATAIPANFTLAVGKTIRFIGGAAANTAAATLAVNGLLATNITRQTSIGPVSLTGGEIQPGQLVECYYDGVQFQFLNSPSTPMGGYGALANLAASATPDLGTIASHNINLTGGPFTITSFGSSASVIAPMYLVRFNAANPMTNSASLNLLGTPVTRTTAIGDQGVYFYNGAGVWYELAYFPAKPHYAPTTANALVIKNNAVTPTTKIDITASEIILDNSAGVQQYVDSYYGGGTCTIDLSLTGSGGLDTGVLAANTWYYIYATGDGGINTNCIASASATAPTLPAGTPFKMRIGAIRTLTAAATLWLFQQRGNTTDILDGSGVNHYAVSGILGTCGGVSPSVLAATATVYGSLAPTTASKVITQPESAGGGLTCVDNQATNRVYQHCVFSGGAATYQNTAQFTLPNTGVATLFACGAAATSFVSILGWVDTVNAN
jgi:hypothetical protein